jgi:hypothetical protein
MPVNKRQKKKPAIQRVAAAIPPPPGPEASSEEIETYFSKYSWAQIEKAGHMRPLSKEETSWVAAVSTEARKKIESRQNRAQLNLALPVDQLARFTQYAQKKHIPPSTLARAWLLERLEQESKEIP